MAKSKKITRADAWLKLDNREHIWKYFTNDRINFCVSKLAPGQTSNIDEGHKGADEIFYVVSGTVVVSFPDIKEWIEVNTEDAIVISEDERHQLINTSSQDVIIVCVTAPAVNVSRRPGDVLKTSLA